MSCLDTLIETRNSIEASEDVPSNHKLLVINLIENERKVKEAKRDSFYYFFTDVTSREDIFDFKTELNELYKIAQEHADFCIDIFISISQLAPSTKLKNWLSSSIKMVDCIAIHYLQTVLNEKPEKQGSVGIERSIYMQINTKGIKAHKAGRIMTELYNERSKMEHQIRNDPDNPDKKIFHSPNYKKIIIKIQKLFPEALDSFDNAYKEHQTSKLSLNSLEK